VEERGEGRRWNARRRPRRGGEESKNMGAGRLMIECREV